MSHQLFTFPTDDAVLNGASVANTVGSSLLWSDGLFTAIFQNNDFAFTTQATELNGRSLSAGSGYSFLLEPLNPLPVWLNPLFPSGAIFNDYSLGSTSGFSVSSNQNVFSIGLAVGISLSNVLPDIAIEYPAVFALELDRDTILPIWANSVFQSSGGNVNTYISRVRFPDIEPSTRSFTSLGVAITSTVSQSGVVSKRAWSNKPSKADLKLTFENIPDSEAAAILQTYNAANGSATEIYLPDLVFAGMSAELQTQWKNYLTAAGMRWFFSDTNPPSLESAFPGRSTMEVVMVAEQRRALDEYGFNKVVFITMAAGSVTTS